MRIHVVKPSVCASCSSRFGNLSLTQYANLEVATTATGQYEMITTAIETVEYDRSRIQSVCQNYKRHWPDLGWFCDGIHCCFRWYLVWQASGFISDGKVF